MQVLLHNICPIRFRNLQVPTRNNMHTYLRYSLLNIKFKKQMKRSFIIFVVLSIIFRHTYCIFCLGKWLGERQT
jgi:hypothetical protein